MTRRSVTLVVGGLLCVALAVLLILGNCGATPGEIAAAQQRAVEALAKAKTAAETSRQADKDLAESDRELAAERVKKH